MKRLSALVLLLCLTLCACTGPAVNTTLPTTVAPSTAAPTTAAPTTEPTTEPTTAPATEPTTVPTTAAPTEPPVLYRSPLTGQPLDEPMTQRPYAVMLNNVRQAMPLYGAAEADILYEALVEGGLTRCMGIYSDIASVQTIGSIRSARKYFVSLAMGYDAIYVHYGKSDVPGSDVGAQQYLEETGWNHMDGTSRGYPYFYDSEDRKNDGYSLEHRHFLVGSRAVDYARDNWFALSREDGIDYGWEFVDDRILVGENAGKITVWFNYGEVESWQKSTTLTYDPESGLYLSSQYGKDNIDANTGETLAFRNVIVLRASTRRYLDTERLYIDLVGSGTGYYACNGQIIPIRWSRDSAYDPFVYTMENGKRLTLSVGKTYVAVVPTKATVWYE